VRNNNRSESSHRSEISLDTGMTTPHKSQVRCSGIMQTHELAVWYPATFC